MASLLVVDDDVVALDAFCTVLAEAGHAVERASSGIAALDIIDRKEHLDLLLTDVVMPGLHGFNLARMAVLRRPALKVLYFSGCSEMPLTGQDEGQKFGKLLHKPIEPDELKRAVGEALAHGGG